MSRAATHLLRQMQKDPRLAWLIGPGSRSYELLTEDAALANGQDVEAFRAAHEATLQFTPWPHSEVHATATVDIDIGELLRTRVQPGEELSMADLLTRFSLPINAVAESAMRRALVREGFTQIREGYGIRRRLWVLVAPHAILPQGHPTPHPQLCKQFSQPLACRHSGLRSCDQTPASPQRAAQHGQTVLHSQTTSCEISNKSEVASLASEKGGAA